MKAIFVVFLLFVVLQAAVALQQSDLTEDELSAIIVNLEDDAEDTEVEISGVPRLIELIDVVIDRLRQQIADMGVAFVKYKADVDKEISSDQKAIDAYQSRTDVALKVKNSAVATVSTLSGKINDLESKSIPEKSAAIDAKVLAIALADARMKKEELVFKEKQSNIDLIIKLFESIQVKLAANNFAEVEAEVEAELSQASEMLVETDSALVEQFELMQNTYRDEDVEAMKEMIRLLIVALKKEKTDVASSFANDKASAIVIMNDMNKMLGDLRSDLSETKSTLAITKSKLEDAKTAVADAEKVIENYKKEIADLAKLNKDRALLLLSKRAAEKDLSVADHNKQIKALIEIKNLLKNGDSTSKLAASKALSNVDLALPVWEYGPWGTCSTLGVQTRTATCRPAFAGSTKPCAGKPVIESSCVPPAEAKMVNMGCKLEHVATLRQWIASRFGSVSSSFTLKYQATRDGFSSSDFHSRVDGVQRLLVVMKNRDYIFGGCTKVAFNGGAGYVHDSNAFLFTLVNPWSIQPTMFTPRYPQYAIYSHPSYGPTYGGGHDIYVPSNAQNAGGYTNLHSYVDTTGRGNTLFVGQQSLGTMSEILAYQV